MASSAGPAELILTGARLVGGEAAAGGADAVALRDGKIVAVGPSAEVLARRGPGTRVVDLGGRAVGPAFVDHHVHLLNVGLSLRNAELDETLFLDLSGLDREAIAARVAERAAELPPGAWILGKGWSQGAWGAVELPDRGPLTEAAPRHPVFLTRVDGHAGWANAAALDAAGIDAETPNPPGGEIRRRPDGSPTGVLLERANDLVLPLLPQPSDEDVQRAFRLATEALAAQGVVDAFDAGFLPMPGVVGLDVDLGRYLDLLVAEDAASPLPLRVHLMIPAPSRLAEAVVASPERFRRLSPRVGVTHLKLFADGAMGSRGAALSRPFSDDPGTRGVPRMDAAEITLWGGRALDAGLDVAVHAIGDAAVGAAFDAFAVLLAERPELDPRRLRLEHFSFATAPDIARAGELGVVLSVQPNFVIPGPDGTTMEDARVGAADASRVYAWGSAARAGARLAFGSDYFTAPAAPLLTFHAAVTRQNAAGEPPGGWHPGERLTREAAWRVLTTRFVPGGGEPATGALRPGQPADLVVLSADPLAIAADGLLAIEVHATLLDGRVVHRTAELAGLAPASPTP